MTKCIVKGCPNTSRKNSRGTGVTLHGFPNTLERIKLWLRQIGRDHRDLDTFAQRVLETRKRNIFRICSVHFSPQSYVWEGKKLVLRKDAFPTIFHGCKSTASFENNSGITPAKKAKIETTSEDQEKPQPTQWRLCPSTKTLILENGQNTYGGMNETDARLCDNPVQAKKMVDASTSTDLCMCAQGLNLDGEPWKVKCDHCYPSILHAAAKPMKEQKGSFAYPDDAFIKQNSTVFEQRIACSDLDAQDTIRVRMHKSEWTPDNTRASVAEPADTFKVSKREVVMERKFIVFESCLDDLFYRLACQFGDGCRAPIVQLEKHIDGTFLSVDGLCHNGHRFHLWRSQPFVNHVAAGNLLCASAILFSGSSFNKVQEMSQLMGLQQITSSDYRRYQERVLFPVVDLHWQQECQRLKDALKDTQLTVIGSSQHGGASLCAKHCTYAFIDVATKRILDFQIEKLLPNTSPFAVERKAFETCLSRLLSENYDIQTVVTHSGRGMKKVMHEKFLHLQHKYDPWQYAKRLRSHLQAASRKKACSGLGIWIPSITSHLFRSLYASQGNVHILRDHWRSLLVGDVSQRCPRNPKEPSLRPSLKRDSPAFQELRELVLSSRVIKDLGLMSPIYHQRDMFCNFTVKYRPKRANYKTDALQARTKLAILAHNASVHRRHIKHLRRCSMTPLPRFLKVLYHRSTKWEDQAAMEEHVIEMICDVLYVYAGNVRHSGVYTPESQTHNITIRSGT